jgi:putative ABC transport system substrate-binding protein
MNRRECVTLLGGAATWPFAARAQQPQRIRRVGVLMSTAEDDPQGQSVVAGVLKGLAQLGWVLGHNMQVDYRWAADDQVRGKTYAAEIVGLKPDVILISGSLPLQLLQQLTQSIPIVFTNINDPVGSGFVAGLARPGANITGFTPGDVSMYEKYPELLKQVAPAISRMAVLFKPDQSPQTGMLHTIEAVAPSMGLAITGAGVRSREDIERAIESVVREPGVGLIVLGNPVTTINRDQIVALAARHRLPAIYPYRAAGCMLYQPSEPMTLCCGRVV